MPAPRCVSAHAVVAMKGNFMLGLNFVFIKLYPMRVGATMMSAFLVNTAIVLAMAPAILQFCATAFAVYGAQTDIFDIFGNQVRTCGGELEGEGAAPRTQHLAQDVSPFSTNRTGPVPQGHLVALPVQRECVLGGGWVGGWGHGASVAVARASRQPTLCALSSRAHPQIFIFMLFGFVILSIVWMVFRGKQQWQRKRSKYDVYAES